MPVNVSEIEQLLQPLDNRKCNLRIVTPKQNSMNQSSRKNSTSKYIGYILIKIEVN